MDELNVPIADIPLEIILSPLEENPLFVNEHCNLESYSTPKAKIL
jgi:hypothetical protein